MLRGWSSESIGISKGVALGDEAGLVAKSNKGIGEGWTGFCAAVFVGAMINVGALVLSGARVEVGTEVA